VDGEPGSGKSLLLRDAVEEAAEHGFSVAVGAADQLGAAIPFYALRMALGEPFAAITAGDSDRDLMEVTTFISRMRAHLERRAAVAPVLVCLDDLHWASPDTLAALRTLPRDLARHPVAWLLSWSATPRGTGGHLADILTADGTARVTLGPLGQDAVTAMLTGAFGAPPGQALADLASGADGNSSLAAELIGGLRDDNAVRVTGGRAELVSDRLPRRIHRLAERRLDDLGAQARHLLMTAAVLDPEFRLEDVAKMLGKPPAMLLPAAEEAMRATLVTAAGHTFAFRHELLRRAVSEMVPKPAARALHRQYGEILLARGGPADRAASHLLRAAHPADRMSLAGLDKAVTRTRRSAPRTAADLAVRALELTPPADPDALPRAVAAAETLAAAGRLGQAAQIARDMLTRPLPTAAEARMRCALSLALCAGGLVRDAADQAQLALALPRLPRDLRDQALTARLQALTGLEDEFLGQAAGHVLAAPDHHDRHAAAAAMVARAVVSWRGGQLGDALELLRDASRDGTGISCDARHAQPLLVLAAALIDVRELGEAEKLLRAADGRTPPHTPAGAALSLLHARVQLAASRLDEAAASAGAALAIAGQTDAHAYAAVARGVLSAVELRRGDITAASGHLARRPVTGPQFADIYAHAESITAEARLTEARDGPSAVLGDLRQLCADIPARSGLLAGDPVLAAWLARAALAAGDGELAARVARAARALADAHPAFPALAAAAAHSEGITLRDPALLSEAAAGHPDSWAKASAAEDLGVLHAGEGDTDQAIRALNEALCGYRRVRADRDQARVRGRLRQLGVRRRHWSGARPARPLTGWDSLTETEQVVSRLVAQGLSNKQVGDRMFISVHTVAHYLRQAFRKLAINSRVELTRIVIEQAEASGETTPQTSPENRQKADRRPLA
jgi:DNA-binding CsgD family transcriptional regulator/tetratricopeptide (TPR) repeat protein